MALSNPYRRRLHVTPSSSKRRKVMTQTSIPKSLMPELKQFIRTGALSSIFNSAYTSVPVSMGAGTSGVAFLGSKFRIERVRVYYDYSGITVTEGIRMALGIPKDPSNLTILETGANSTTLPANMRKVTILKERFLKTDGSDLNGFLEWKGPLNVEMDDAGAVALKNNLIFQVNSANAGSDLAASGVQAIEVLFTG